MQTLQRDNPMNMKFEDTTATTPSQDHNLLALSTQLNTQLQLINATIRQTTETNNVTITDVATRMQALTDLVEAQSQPRTLLGRLLQRLIFGKIDDDGRDP